MGSGSNQEQYKQLYEKIKELLEENKLGDVISKTLNVLKQEHVSIYDTIIAVEVDEDQDFIIVRIYTQHGLKVVLRVDAKGRLVRWIEGINECSC